MLPYLFAFLHFTHAQPASRGDGLPMQVPRRVRMHSNTRAASRSPKITHAAPDLPWSRFRAVTVVHEPCSTLAFTLTNFAGNLGPDWPLLVLYTPRAAAAVLGNRIVRYLARYGGLATLPLSALGDIQGVSPDLTDVAQYSRLCIQQNPNNHLHGSWSGITSLSHTLTF